MIRWLKQGSSGSPLIRCISVPANQPSLNKAVRRENFKPTAQYNQLIHSLICSAQLLTSFPVTSLLLLTILSHDTLHQSQDTMSNLPQHHPLLINNPVVSYQPFNSHPISRCTNSSNQRSPLLVPFSPVSYPLSDSILDQSSAIFSPPSINLAPPHLQQVLFSPPLSVTTDNTDILP